MSEIWKAIPILDNTYEASNTGKVRRITDKKPVSVYTNNWGYTVARMIKDGHNHREYVHRLVALAWIPNLDNLPTVNHLNEIKDDNHVENLEWCSFSRQNSYGEGAKQRRLSNSIRILQFTKEGKHIACWNSIKDAAASVGVNQRSIGRASEPKCERHATVKGYTWARCEKGDDSKCLK